MDRELAKYFHHYSSNKERTAIL